MKLDKNNKYFTIAVYALAVILACIILVFICINNALSSSLSRIGSALSPVLYGLVFAYLFKPIVVFLDMKVLKFIKQPRVKRLISILITFIFHLARMLLEISAIFVREMFAFRKPMMKSSSPGFALYPMLRISRLEHSASEIGHSITEQ